MSHILSMEQALSQLDQLVSQLGPDDEIILTRNQKTVARILPSSDDRQAPKAGVCKGMLEILDDSDEVILEQFKDYLP